MHPSSLPFLAVAALAAALPAQVLPGDIAVTGFSTSAFGIATPPNPTATPYVTSGFGGTGAATSQSILHWRANLNEFFVGGFGFVGRATITGPGVVAYTLLTNGISTAAQMSWDSSNNIVVADAGTDQVRSVSLNGTVTDLSVGAQPWGANVNAGAWDPRTGDVVVGGNGGLYRLVNGTTTGVTLATGLGGFVSAVAFDPQNGDVLAAILTASRIVRVDPTGLVTDVVPPSTVLQPNALDLDLNGDLIVGGNAGAIFRVPIGGPATLIATNGSPGTNVSGLSVAKISDYAGVMYTACAATNGPALLSTLGPWVPGATFQTRSVNHAPGALGLVILGLSDLVYQGLPLPFLLDPVLGTSNCFLNVAADVTFAGLADANGVLAFPLTAPPAFAGFRVYAQHAALENVPGGFSFSNGAFLQY